MYSDVPPLFARGRDNGVLAQLGERLDGIQKVRGSTPLDSILGLKLIWESVWFAPRSLAGSSPVRSTFRKG